MAGRTPRSSPPRASRCQPDLARAKQVVVQLACWPAHTHPTAVLHLQSVPWCHLLECRPAPNSLTTTPTRRYCSATAPPFTCHSSETNPQHQAPGSQSSQNTPDSYRASTPCHSISMECGGYASSSISSTAASPDSRLSRQQFGRKGTRHLLPWPGS
jgi:hypothetical protein